MLTKFLAGLLVLMTAFAAVGWYFALNPAALRGAGQPAPEEQTATTQGPAEKAGSTGASGEHPLVVQTRVVLLKVSDLACGDRPSDPAYCACLREEVLALTSKPTFAEDLKVGGAYDQRKIMLTMTEVRNICVAKATNQ